MDNILESALYVQKHSKHVTIESEKINEIIKVMKLSDCKHWLESNPFDILSLDIENLVQLLLIYHSVGFCYWQEPKWSVKIDDVKYDGGFAMLGILVTRFKKDSSKISETEFLKLVKSDNEIPLIKQRLINLSKIEDGFYQEIKNIKTDIELFNYIINKYEHFKDESIYNGEKIYFYKLAQLLVSDILHIREIKENIIVDYTNLIGCADYKIPQVLNCYGILEYSCELNKIIENKVEIRANSIYEIEIRANTLAVINEIYIKANKILPRIQINDFIWLMGQDKTKVTKLYHRTYTSFY